MRGKEDLGLGNKDEVGDGVVSYKIGGDGGDLCKGLGGGREGEDGISKGGFEFGWIDELKVGLDGDGGREFEDERLGGE
ncbi:phosphomethylpyrimidine synthase ThiC [Staphylococcus hominis]|uniref:phosphomethylpyrimidine synthase ThiC n=1 Tax=Staphylococcus hominis TaxID=1290 RepID=UPI00119EA8A2|nr:phosphomethylpyrimidine synthase ThiC [Staphylococcus hominis]